MHDDISLKQLLRRKKITVEKKSIHVFLKKSIL